MFALGSAVAFLAATGVDDLLLGRLLSGLSAGVATGTATAAVFHWLSVPAQVRPVFVIAVTAGFAGFAVLGLFNAVSPSFVAGIIGIGNHAVAGAIVCSIFAASACAQLASGRIEANRAVAVGCAVLVIGMLIIAASLLFFESGAADPRRRGRGRRPGHQFQPGPGSGR